MWESSEVRVCHAVFSSPGSPLAGGGQWSVHHLANAMAETGNDVHVIYSRRRGDNAVSGARYTMHFARYRGVQHVPCDFVGQAAQLAQLLRRERFDAVFAHGENALLFPSLCVRGGAELVAVFHAVRLPGPPGFAALRSPQRIWRDLDHLMLHRVIARSDRVAAYSEHARALVENGLGAACPPVQLIRPGVDPAWWRIERIAPAAGAPLRLLFWGRLARVKGVKHLLAALPRIASRVGDVSLDIVGTGADEHELRRQALRAPPCARVRFHGVGRAEEIQRLCRAADVAVFPTLDESFGQAIAQGLASGVPVVSTTAGAVPELLGHGRWGELVAPEDPQALADGVLRVATNAAASTARAAAARDHVRSTFRWDRAASLLLAGRP